ncbi:hypothetical protein MASR2M41_01920 [Flammeovirgaceae bacterium]
MVASDIINLMIPPLKASDDAHKAMVWMEEFRCNHLPVIENNHLLGFISEGIILEGNDIDKKLSDFKLVGKQCIVSRDSHFYDILRIAGDHKLQLVAVIDEEGEYEGVIAVQDIMTSFAQSAAVQTPGGILIISLALIDYSLAEISRLIEENNAKILSSIVVEDPLDNRKIKLTIKINQLDLTRIVATLERFEYKIIGRYQEDKKDFEDKDRIDMLMRYLNI